MRKVKLWAILALITGAFLLSAGTAYADCPEDDDSFEPNDDFASAATVEVGNSYELFSCSENDDYFKFVPTEDCTLKVSITPAPGEVGDDLDLYLYDSEEHLLESSATYSYTEEVAYPVTTGETYYIKVRAYWTYTDFAYILDLQCLQCDNDEYEPNNDYQHATELPDEGTYNAIACYMEEDWYMFEAQAGQRINITVTVPEDSELEDVDIYLYSDPEGSRVASDTIMTDGALEISYSAETSGIYFLKVKNNYQTKKGAYTLEFALCTPICDGKECGPDGCGGLCGECGPSGICNESFTCEDCEDSFEPNDSSDQATDLTIGNDPTGLMACGSDEDWFIFSSDQECLFTATVNNFSEETNLNLYLYDDPSSSSKASSTSSSASEETVRYVVEANVPYYLKVKNMTSDAATHYDLATSCEVCENDAYEGDPNNNESDRAYTITPGTYEDMKACPKEMDWYQFHAPAGAHVDVKIEFDASIGDLDLYIYSNPSGSYLDSSTSSTSSTEHVDYVNPTEQTLYIKVRNYSYTAQPYTLTLTMCVPNCDGKECGVDGCGGTCGTCDDSAPYCTSAGTCSADCENDSYEPNDDVDQAYQIADDIAEMTGLYICPGDFDVFAINVGDGQMIDLDFEKDFGDSLKWALIDANGACLTRNCAYGTYTAAMADTVYMFVFGNTETSYGAYHFNWTLTDSQCTDDSYEPNDTMFSATVITDSFHATDLMLCPANADMYKVTIEPGATIQADATFIDNDGDIDMFLYKYDATDHSFSTLASSSTTSNDEHITYTNSTEETIEAYLYLYAYSWGVASNTYGLDVTITTPEPEVDGDEEVVEAETEGETVVDGDVTEETGTEAETEVPTDGDITEEAGTEEEIDGDIAEEETPPVDGDVSEEGSTEGETTTDGDVAEETDTEEEVDGDMEDQVDIEVVCNAGEMRCNDDGDVEQCKQDGSAWEVIDDCTADETCTQVEPGLFECVGGGDEDIITEGEGTVDGDMVEEGTTEEETTTDGDVADEPTEGETTADGDVADAIETVEEEVADTTDTTTDTAVDTPADNATDTPSDNAADTPSTGEEKKDSSDDGCAAQGTPTSLWSLLMLLGGMVLIRRRRNA